MLVPAIDHIRTFVDNLHTFSERLLLTLHVYLLLFDNLAVLLFRNFCSELKEMHLLIMLCRSDLEDESNPKKYLEEEYLETEKKVV
jgi:hypothetical protein